MRALTILAQRFGGLRGLIGLSVVLMLGGCATTPPRQTEDVCGIFKEKRSWYKQAKRAADRWDSDVSTIMAFIHQESRFQATARPPRRKILWVIPGPRPSDSYGYAQAKRATWEWYQKDSGRWGASRRDFGDAADFIGWYNRQSRRLSNIPRTDVNSLYLAYHEGHGGFNRRTFNNKAWLLNVSHRVQQRAATYERQLASCEAQLQRRRWWPF